MAYSTATVQTQCPMCGSQDSRERFNAVDKGLGSYDLRQCGRCRGTFISSPIDASVLERWYEDYHGVKNAEDASPQRSQTVLQKRVEVFLKELPIGQDLLKNMNYLDIGCGEGAMVRGLSPYVKKAAGFERSPEAVLSMTERGIAAEAGNIEDTHPNSGPYDLISMFDIIEHLQNPSLAIRHIHEALTPNGWLCITTPNANSLKFAILQEKWAYCAPPEHVNLFTEKGLTLLLRSEGFKVFSVSPASRLEYFPKFGLVDTFRYLTGKNTTRLSAQTAKPGKKDKPADEFQKNPFRTVLKALNALAEYPVSWMVNRVRRSCHIYLFARKGGV